MQLRVVSVSREWQREETELAKQTPMAGIGREKRDVERREARLNHTFPFESFNIDSTITQMQILIHFYSTLVSALLFKYSTIST